MFACKSRQVALLTVASLIFASSSSSVFAQDADWKKTHPRRAEVNARLKNQNQRINQEVKEGDMSKAKAAKLKKEDHQIRREERAMASQNGGHLTKQEQKTLNQQENAVSKKIGQ